MMIFKIVIIGCLGGILGGVWSIGVSMENILKEIKKIGDKHVSHNK